MEACETSNNRVGLFPEDSRGACEQCALVVHSVHLSSCRRVAARSLLLTMDPRDETEDGAPNEGRDPGEVESQVIGAQLVTKQPCDGWAHSHGHRHEPEQEPDGLGDVLGAHQLKCNGRHDGDEATVKEAHDEADGQERPEGSAQRGRRGHEPNEEEGQHL